MNLGCPGRFPVLVDLSPSTAHGSGMLAPEKQQG